MNPMLPITRTLIMANVGAFLVQYFASDNIVYQFALWPWGTSLFHVWQLVTYGFLHGGFAHLFFNMFALYMFGSSIEQVLGTRRYLIYYFASVIGAAVMHLLVTGLMGGLLLPTVGASGGVFGLLLAFGMFFPQQRIMLLIPPIPMKAWVFVTLYGLVELAMGVFGTMQGVAHFAHLGGMLAGFILLSIWRLPTRKNHGSGVDW
ncbi:MAG: rhomboid family intramembrane serine protease [Steroidobacteraceae bacterium]